MTDYMDIYDKNDEVFVFDSRNIIIFDEAKLIPKHDKGTKLMVSIIGILI